jgi:cell division protein FtsB
MRESLFDEHSPRRDDDDTVWQRLNRFLYLLIALAFIVAVVALFRGPLLDQQQQASRVETLKAEIARQKALLDKQTREADLLQNDPGYIETIARDKLDMMKQGESIFRLDTPAPSPAPDKAQGGE